jgi:hypothetical protein
MQLARASYIAGIQQDVARTGWIFSGDATQGDLGELRGEFLSQGWRWLHHTG